MNPYARFVAAWRIACAVTLVAAATATAGYDNGFTVTSDDGDFLLRINVEGQFRYVYSAGGRSDPDEGGFVVRRARLNFRGHAADPKLTYRLRLSGDRASGNTLVEMAWVGYRFAPAFNLSAGLIKPAFIREEMVGAFQQLCAERSFAADYFTIDFSEGVEATYTRGGVRGSLAVHDGSYANASEFDAGRSAVAVAGRVDAVLAGARKQFDDFSSAPAGQRGVLLGAALDYEVGDEGAVVELPDVFKYTADVSAEFGVASVFVAVHGQRFADADTSRAGGLPARLGTARQHALVVQGGVFVVGDKVEVFAREEWIDFDGVYYRNNRAGTQTGSADVDHDALSIAAAGVNFYARAQRARFTLDAMVARDPVPASNSGAGLLKSAADGQHVVRAQLQWVF